MDKPSLPPALVFGPPGTQRAPSHHQATTYSVYLDPHFCLGSRFPLCPPQPRQFRQPYQNYPFRHETLQAFLSIHYHGTQPCTDTFLSIENFPRSKTPTSVGARWGHGQYSEDATLKCSFLTTCLPWLFSQVRKPARRLPPGRKGRLRRIHRILKSALLGLGFLCR